MIRTPIGQWINENDISRAGIKINSEFIDGREDRYNTGNYITTYSININCISNNLDIKISPDYDTKEEAQGELDKMFLSNRSK